MHFKTRPSSWPAAQAPATAEGIRFVLDAGFEKMDHSHCLGVRTYDQHARRAGFDAGE
jgi:hypothetical protein